MAQEQSRDELIDALRGFALFGILAVNIQSYLRGLNGSSLGVLDIGSSVADHATVFFTAFLLHYKFYPIFCFCFGYGFAIQTRGWRLRGADARKRFSRRTDFMLGMGVIHGVFLWFGDILTTYALSGKVLARYIGKGPRSLLKALKSWSLVFLVVAVPLTVLLTADVMPVDAQEAAADAVNMARDARLAFDVYSQGSYIAALSQRVSDYVLVATGFVLILPGIMVLFLLGAICAQLGLVRHRGRYRAFWRRVLLWSLAVGIPVNVWHAWGLWSQASNPWRHATLLESLPADFAPTLAVAYVAAAVLAADSATGSRILSWFAPAGRLALSNYLAQSVLMGLLLSGFGLGLGASLSQTGLLQVAVAIYLTLLLVSHAMARFGVNSPLEAAWRRYANADNVKR